VLRSPARVTGCGCVLLVIALGVLLYFFTFGGSDAGPPVEQAALVAALGYAAATIGGRRSLHEVARS
jgi:hypothetical protein